MAPPKRPWFRVYVEMLTDRKLTRIPAEQRWVWVTVLGMARSSPVPGSLLVAEDEPATVEDIAREAFVSTKVAQSAVEYFERIGMLVRGEIGERVVKQFAARQFESDSSVDRVTKHRRSNGDRPTMKRPIEPQCSDDVTPPENREQIQNSKRIPSTPSAPRLAEADFQRFYQAYPRRVGPDEARKALVKALKRAELDVIVAGAERFAAECRALGTERQFIAHPATWLNAGRWADEPAVVANGSAPRLVDVPPRFA